MVAEYTYGTYAVYDPTTNNEVDNGTGGKFVLVQNGPAQPIYDLNGTPITEITSNALGQSSQFRANVPNGLIQFGSVAVTVFANEVGALAVAAYNGLQNLGAISTSGAVLSDPGTVQTFAGAVNFSSATATVFTTVPKVGAVSMITASNLITFFAASQISFHNTTGQPFFIYVNPSTGAWPNSGARVLPDGTSLSTLTAPLIWNSIAYPGAAKPAGMIDGDTWWERVS